MCKYQIGYGRLEEDEDMIVGTKVGLEYLIELCTEAIKEGQSKTQTYEDCEIYAIKKVNADYFIEKEEKQKFLTKMLGLLSIGLVFTSLIVGFITIIKWFI